VFLFSLVGYADEGGPPYLPEVPRLKATSALQKQTFSLAGSTLRHLLLARAMAVKMISISINSGAPKQETSNPEFLDCQLRFG
jgi:hypothetical protein